MKTESNLKPQSQYEVEAIPPIAGRPCTVILYDNIEGPLTRETGTDGESGEYYTFDRYTIDTVYRDGLEADIAKDPDVWIQKAKEAEETGTPATEVEILSSQLKKQSEEIESISQSIDDLAVAVLGGNE